MPASPPVPTIRVVPVHETDLPAVVRLVNQAFTVHRLMSGDRTDVAGLIEEAGPNGQFLHAEHRQRLVGTAMIRPVNSDDDHGIYAPPATALYYGLAAVDTGLMKSGIGRLLLNEAERYALANGRTHIALNTLYEFDLVPYYLNLGYTAVAEELFDSGHWDLTESHRLCHLEKAL